MFLLRCTIDDKLGPVDRQSAHPSTAAQATHRCMCHYFL